MNGVQAKSYKLKLKKLKRDEIHWADSLFGLLPVLGFVGDGNKLVEEVIGEQTGLGVELELESYQQISGSELCNRSFKDFLGITLELLPKGFKLLLQIDSALVVHFVERLLGGVSANVLLPRNISEIELGVFQYLLLQVLARFHSQVSKKGARLLFEEFRAPFLKDMDYVLVVYRVSIAEECGFIKVYLPKELFNEEMASPPVPSELAEIDYKRLLAEMSAYGYVNTVLWAEGGKCVLSSEDCANLGEGDVIIFDQTELESDIPSGKVILRIGDGLSAGVKAAVKREGDKLKCSLEEFC